jgi:CheY-like chemotaxis protein
MASTTEGGRKSLKILVADDDPAVVKAISSRCVELGCEVETATNGVHALIMARRRRPDVLIVDVNMPELDGLSLCTHLLDYSTTSVDVIVVTGSEDPETEIRCESMGMFYGNKKNNFWNSISTALAEIEPGLAEKIAELDAQSKGAKVPIRPRVLLIDDDPAIYDFLASRLSKCGVETLYAPDAAQGIKIARRDQPSAIICDYFMPNGDALYALRKLRGMPETANIPFIVLSGRQLDEPTERSLTRESYGRPGAAKVLRKSMNTDELFESLQKYCGFHRKAFEE